MDKKATEIIKSDKAKVKSVTAEKPADSNASVLSSAELKLESLKTIKNGIMWATIMVGLVLVTLIVFFVVSKAQREIVNDATRYLFFQTQVPLSEFETKIKSKDVDEVVQSFRDAQFMNIKIIPEDDLKKDGSKNGKVTDVTVAGKPIDLFAHKYISKTAQVTIRYHSVKGSGEEPKQIFSGIPALKYIFVIVLLSCVLIVLFILRGVNKRKIRENEKHLTMYEG